MIERSITVGRLQTRQVPVGPVRVPPSVSWLDELIDGQAEAAVTPVGVGVVGVGVGVGAGLLMVTPPAPGEASPG